MGNLLIKPYEISLWKDEQCYAIEDGGARTISTTRTSSDTVTNDFIREIKIGVIGGSDLISPINVYSPELTKNVNGTNTLTFKINTKYYNNDGEFVDNPWLGYLAAEQKIKLKYDDQYYDLVIKSVNESSKEYVNTYTCSDLFIEELSKNGYSLVFETDLCNNTGTAQELAETALDGTNWQVNPNSDVIKQTTTESLFIYTVQSAITGTNLFDSTDTISINKNETILVFYSDLIGTDDQVQFLYRFDGKYIKDSNNIITNSTNWVISRSSLPGLTIDKCEVSKNYSGDKYVRTQLSEYVSILERQCNLYTKDDVKYYGFVDDTYATPESIQNLIANNVSFVNTDGWYCSLDDTGGSITVDTSSSTNILKLTFGSTGAIYNNGLYNLRGNFDNGLVNGTKLALLIKASDTSALGAKIVIKYINKDDQDAKVNTSTIDFVKSTETIEDYVEYFATVSDSISKTNFDGAESINFSLTATSGTNISLYDAKLFVAVYDSNNKLVIPDLSSVQDSIIVHNYKFIKVSTIEGKITADDLTFDETSQSLPSTYKALYSEDYAKISSITASKSNVFNILQSIAETFKCWVRFDISHTSLGVIQYNYSDAGDYYIAGTTYYKSNDDTYELIDLNYDKANPNTESGLFTQMSSSYEFSSSSRYYNKLNGKYYYANIVKSDYDLDPTLYYLFNSTVWKSLNYKVKTYDKYVTFKNYIGQDNYIGFRYGINLDSITRTIDSDSIVTKLIVEQNSNEFSDNDAGFCTIQEADLNTSGENFLLNFDYYVNQGLIDKDSLYNDLYSTDYGIGYLVVLNELNKNIETLTQKQSLYTVQYSSVSKNYQAQQESYNSSNELYNQYRNYLIGNGYSGDVDAESLENETLKGYARQRDRYKNVRDSAKTKYESYKEDLDTITKLLNQISVTLASISLQKNGVTKEFYSKYSRYIREGSWIDEDYTDADLYYLDAQDVLYNSAFPQISYTINVETIDGIEEYQNYHFEIGDETYIEDTEFFGWDENKKPTQQKVVVSEIKLALDDPSSNTITVKNYENRWESLFQRITATTESLQYHEGEYARAASAVTSDGEINSNYLKNAFSNNILLASAISEEISGGQGISIVNSVYPEKEILIGSTGIALKGNDGEWSTAITADGINANVVNTGQLNTENIRIFAGNDPTFVWDKDNLTAYAKAEGIVSDSKYVRFNQYGIQGIQDSKNDSPIFSLGYDGFYLNAINDDNYVHISTEDIAEEGELKRIIWAGKGETDNFIVYEDGSILAQNGTFQGLVKADKIQMKYGDGDTYTDVINLDESGNLVLGSIVLKSKDNEIDIFSSAAAIKDNTNPHIVVKNTGIEFVGTSNLIKTQYSLDKTNWQDNWEESWSSSTTTKVWAHYMYAGQTTYGDPVLIQGSAGADGSDADVTWENVKNALHEAEDAQKSFITATKMGAPNIYSGNIYSSRIYSGDSESEYLQLDGNGGLQLWDPNGGQPLSKAQLSFDRDEDHSGWTFPYLRLGVGSGSNPGETTTYKDVLVIKKFGSSYWFGSAGDLGPTYNQFPGNVDSPQNIDESYTGIAVWLGDASGEGAAIYKVVNGVTTEIGSGSGGTAVFG